MGEESSGDAKSSEKMIMISNALLGFVFNCMHFSTVYNLRAVVLGHFTPDAIHQAKETLAKNVDADVISNSISTKRRGSSAKTKAANKGKSKEKEEMEFDDIMEAMEALDKAGIKLNFQIPAAELHLLPRTRPEDMLSVTVMETIKTLEEQMRKLDRHAATTDSEMRMLSHKVAILERGPHGRPSMSSAPPAPPPFHANTSMNSTPPSDGNSLPAMTYSAPELPSSASSMHPQPPKSYASMMHNHQGSDGVWTKVEKPKNQRPKAVTRKDVQLATKDLRVVTGKGACSTAVKGSVPAKHIYVSRVSSEATVDNIKSYMKDKQVEIRGIRKVSKDDWLHNSFKVTIDADDLEQVLNEDFWSERVCCREWLPFIRRERNKDSTNNHDDDEEEK